MNPQPQRPKISRKPIVLLVSLCLIVSAVLIPIAAKLPKLIEAQLVLGVWWLVWVCVLTWLLFRGDKVDDDIHWFSPITKTTSLRDWAKVRSDRYGGCADLGSGCADPGCFFDDGCGWFLLAISAFALLAFAFLFLFELAIPAIALLLLASIGGMFARAVNDTHHCKGRIGLSLLWGAIWATVYIGPVAAIVIWVAGYLAQRG
ncbi:MAG: hypothetical protein H7Y17_10815 [Chlorobia bacterium]|nr:hypothetical protein [Fimbriimonadaceae bacterium]